MSEPLRFKIEHIQGSEPILVIARQLQKDNFSVGEDSTLGGCKLRKYLDMPRATKEDGSQDLDVFVFSLANSDDRHKFKVGQSVEFIQ
jgi:hypothetical protein